MAVWAAALPSFFRRRPRDEFSGRIRRGTVHPQFGANYIGRSRWFEISNRGSPRCSPWHRGRSPETPLQDAGACRRAGAAPGPLPMTSWHDRPFTPRAHRQPRAAPRSGRARVATCAPQRAARRPAPMSTPPCKPRWPRQPRALRTPIPHAGLQPCMPQR